jgi:hypothetical protein
MHPLTAAIRRLPPPVGEDSTVPPYTFFEFGHSYLRRLAALCRQGVTITDDMRLDIFKEEWEEDNLAFQSRPQALQRAIVACDSR